MVQKVLPFYLKNVQKLQNSMLLYLNYTSFEIRDILKFAMALCDELIANFEGYLYRISTIWFTKALSLLFAHKVHARLMFACPYKEIPV